IHLYQTYEAAHAYDLLTPTEKIISDTMAALTSPFVKDPDELNAFKGNTWSGTVFGLKLSDPLAVVAQTAASQSFYWPFILTALIPLILTLLFGRIYCGWICPATLIYELNDNLAAWFRKAGLSISLRKMDRRIKYIVLGFGILLSMYLGAVMFGSVYPPAIIGREIYYTIALGGFGFGAIFFLITLLFDLLIIRRGFCRYICPGGALYSILGRYRLLRIKRNVATCNDCAKCNVVCQFGLDPLQDDFGMECNNCTACIAVCPTDALKFTVNINDVKYQGPGHLGHKYRKEKN
ncbi:MAG: 4Fe-4S binding protein, partial [Thiohalomonadales bacterium]